MSVYELAESILDDNVDHYRHARAFVRPDGSIVWLDVTAVVLRDGAGAPQFILAAGHDITRIKELDGSGRCFRDASAQTEAVEDVRCCAQAAGEVPAAGTAVSERQMRLEQASDELDALCRAVSHDVRAPVRIMSGFAEILLSELEGSISDEQLYFLRAIRQQSQRLGRLLDGLLELTRLTRSTVTRSPIDLGARAEWIFEELRRAEHGRRIELLVEPGLRASGDPALVDTLLEHLLSNACKFTRGTEQARIEIGCSRGSDVPTFFVRDNGVGFDMAHAHKLFRTFERLHPADDFGGEGLGLASVKRIVRRHGGGVWAQSSPGQGATFYFTLE